MKGPAVERAGGCMSACACSASGRQAHGGGSPSSHFVLSRLFPIGEEAPADKTDLCVRMLRCGGRVQSIPLSEGRLYLLVHDRVDNGEEVPACEGERDLQIGEEGRGATAEGEGLRRLRRRTYGTEGPLAARDASAIGSMERGREQQQRGEQQQPPRHREA
eukprot:scaffold108231_cov28-Tisochrysis_lutea.AAC.1